MYARIGSDPLNAWVLARIPRAGSVGPPPPDRDGDGVPDASDGCPDQPADKGALPTNGDDILNGTALGETICGLLGNDTINGLGGNDTLNGGTGNDKLHGGAGNDSLSRGVTGTTP